MLNTELFFSVPNKCASQYMNQLAFQLMQIPKDAVKKGTRVYSYRSAVQHEQKKFSPNQIHKMCQRQDFIKAEKMPNGIALKICPFKT